MHAIQKPDFSSQPYKSYMITILCTILYIECNPCSPAKGSPKFSSVRQRAGVRSGVGQVDLHALVFCRNTCITGARDFLKPGPVANPEAPPHIGDQPFTSEESEGNIH